jgi:hypothetical protein
MINAESMLVKRMPQTPRRRNMKDTGEKWIPPQLIVLGRGTPEENVLGGCKTSRLTGMAATKTNCKKRAKSGCSGNRCSTISKTS